MPVEIRQVTRLRFTTGLCGDLLFLVPTLSLIVDNHEPS